MAEVGGMVETMWERWVSAEAMRACGQGAWKSMFQFIRVRDVSGEGEGESCREVEEEVHAWVV